MTLQNLRKEICSLFKSNNIESPETDSGLIIMHALGIDKTTLLVKNDTVPQKAYLDIVAMSKRRINGEPVRYITGICPFMELEFYVNSSTLIPRQDTEVLIDEVSRRIDDNVQTELWDIGCGSGCIGISLAYRHKKLFVREFDISQAALDTAFKNAKRYGLEERVKFTNHDIFLGMPTGAAPDILVSNPPYIPTDEINRLKREVKDYEPRSALDGGDDGLKFYREIIKKAPLKTGGTIAFEIGCDQAEAVTELLKQNGYQSISLTRDLSQNPRVITAIR